eukprot:scaffold166882_cov80-Cyclotella_meneghiniana.AAC.4
MRAVNALTAFRVRVVSNPIMAKQRSGRHLYSLRHDIRYSATLLLQKTDLERIFFCKRQI